MPKSPNYAECQVQSKILLVLINLIYRSLINSDKENKRFATVIQSIYNLTFWLLREIQCSEKAWLKNIFSMKRSALFPWALTFVTEFIYILVYNLLVCETWFLLRELWILFNECGISHCQFNILNWKFHYLDFGAFFITQWPYIFKLIFY